MGQREKQIEIEAIQVIIKIDNLSIHSLMPLFDIIIAKISNMSGNADWNQYSSEQESDWMGSSSDSDDQPKKEQPQNPQTQKQEQSPNEQPQDTNSTSENKPNVANENKEIKKQQAKPDKPKRTYPTDAEILADYESGKIPCDTNIKVLRCKAEQKKIIQEFKHKPGIKEFREESYILFFKEKDHLLEFIKQKMEKKYHFKLGIFHGEKREKEKTQKYENRDKNKNYGERKEHKKIEYRAKDQGENKGKEERKQVRGERDEKQQGRYRKADHKDKRQRRYEDEKKRQNRSKQKEYNRGDKQRNRQEKDRQKEKRQSAEMSIQIIDKKTIRLLNTKASPETIVDYLKINKFFSQFKKIPFLFPPQHFDYAQQIFNECYSKHKYGLETVFTEKDWEQKEIKAFVLEGKEPVKTVKTVKGMTLGQDQDYFINLEKVDMHVIPSDCDFLEKEYFEQFKKNYPLISKNKRKWTIKAFDKNIAKGLRLYSTFKKNMPTHELNLKVGQQSQPFVCIEIGKLDEQMPKQRGKPDTSAANSYLNA